MPTPARQNRHARTQTRTRHVRVAVPEQDVLEATLRDWLQHLPPTPGRSGPGRPPTLPAVVLWTALLVGVLRGLSSQRSLWRLVSQWGLWHFPRVDVGDMAVYKRLERAGPETMQQFFQQITALIRERCQFTPAVAHAPFAAEIFALDQTVLDPVLRHRKILRDLPSGSHALLPGVLNCLFDVRRQQWRRVDFSPEAMANEKPAALALLEGLPEKSLLLFDLGYFSFPWFDQLCLQGFYFVSRLRKQVSYKVIQVLYTGGNQHVQLRESLIYLGAHAGDRAAYPLRLVEITRGQTTYRYLTNVRDPRLLPAWQVVDLYKQRWDIEQAFSLLKTHLGLHLLWSAYENVLLHQVYATLILAQVVLALRAEIATRAGADVREVSLPLLLQTLPQLAADGKDPVALFAERGRAAGCIRPFRTRDYGVPHVPLSAYTLPERLPPRRPARYGYAKTNPAHAALQQLLNSLPPDPGALLA
jgi:hypothetical protein